VCESRGECGGEQFLMRTKERICLVFVCVCVCMCLCMCVYWVLAFVCVFVCVFVFVLVCVCVCEREVCVLVHKHTRTHIHAHQNIPKKYLISTLSQPATTQKKSTHTHTHTNSHTHVRAQVFHSYLLATCHSRQQHVQAIMHLYVQIFSNMKLCETVA